MPGNPPIYLDHNSTTPLDPRVLEAMLPFFTEYFGNAASRTHAFGWQAEEAVRIAREQVARAIGAVPEEIVFTSGSTEALNLALKGIARNYQRKGQHVITVATEHKAVLDVCDFLEQSGFTITRLPVRENGLIDLEEFRAAITEETILACVMLANNETGVIQPLREIAAIAKEEGVLILSDGTQGPGKISVDVNDLGVDLLALSAHKVYGPKGVGALYVRRRNPRVVPAPLIHGGGHERGYRSGTLNVPGIVGFGKAMELSAELLPTESVRLNSLRDRLEMALCEVVETTVNGADAPRLPNTLNISFGYVNAEALILSMRQLAVSTGSACTSASIEPSHVLAAMGLDDERAYASIRFSLGRGTTGEEIDATIEIVEKAIRKLRSRNAAWRVYVEAGKGG